MKFITATLLDELATRAKVAPRRRTHHNLHEVPEDPVQRLFIAAEPDSYFRPHRHRDKAELAVVVRGVLDLLTFDENGRVATRSIIGPEQQIIGFETPAGAFHTLVAKAAGSVFFEVKRGPYDPQTAAEFAPWSPAEGTPEAAEFFRRLCNARVGELIA